MRSLFTHYVLIYNTAKKEKLHKKKVFKIHDIKIIQVQF